MKGSSDFIPNISPSSSSLGLPKIRTKGMRHGEIKMTNEGRKKFFYGRNLQEVGDWLSCLSWRRLSDRAGSERRTSWSKCLKTSSPLSSSKKECDDPQSSSTPLNASPTTTSPHPPASRTPKHPTEPSPLARAGWLAGEAELPRGSGALGGGGRELRNKSAGKGLGNL